MFVIISKSHFTLVVLKPNFSFINGTKNGKIVLCFFIRNSCTRFDLVSTLLPSLQKKWYSAFSVPPPPHIDVLHCSSLRPLYKVCCGGFSLFPPLFPSSSLLLRLHFFWRVGGEGDDTSKTISIFAIKMWFRIDILTSSALKMNLTIIF